MTKHLLVVVLIAMLAALPMLTGCTTAPKALDPTIGETAPENPEEVKGLPSVASGPPTDDQDPAKAGEPDAGPKFDLLKRAQSAVEGMVLGAVIGSQAGPIGAAVGAGTLLIYAAITGHVPLKGGPGPSPRGERDEQAREEELEEELDREIERGDNLEGQIEAELQRQEVLLDQMESEDAALAAERARSGSQPIAKSDLKERADTRSAPLAPEDRELPLAIFEKEAKTIPEGEWDNERELEVISRSLDADQDGRAEQVRYFDERSGEFLRKEQDRDYDGEIDTWQDYKGGKIVRRVLDTNADGQPDVWEFYRAGRMSSREIDRNHDGVRDAEYNYVGDSLVEESHDANDDGVTDLAVKYEDRLRKSVDEDRDRDGRMDQWTKYGVWNGEEVVVRIEKDTTGDGKPDIFETFHSSDGEPVLAKREEDKNGDGQIDITSIYKNGKLVRREISDPDLVPL